MAQMRQGLAARRAEAAGVTLAEYPTRLGEAYGRIGQAEEGLRLLAEALAVMDKDPWYEAEMHRIKGELLLRQAVPEASQAEACFQQALVVSRRQQARSWELRTAMSLARLWQQQGKRAEAVSSRPRSTAGSLRALIPPTSRRLGHCSMHWRERVIVL
jgi:predicted ATPase